MAAATTATPLIPPAPYSAPPVCTNCCGSCEPQKPMPAYVKPMEIVIEVAFVIFAAIKAPVALAISIGVGAAYQIVLIIIGVEIPKGGRGSVSCGQSNGEQYMGRGLLPYEIVFITALYFFDHIRHEPEFYVPILGFYAGTRIVWTIYTWTHDSDSKPQVNAVVQPAQRASSPTREHTHHHNH